MKGIENLKSKLANALVFMLLVALVVYAQQIGGTQTAQQAQHYDAATNVSYSRTSAATITITPPGGQFVYITALDISNCAGASAVTAAAPTYITTTNISGNPQYQLGSGVTAGLCTTVALPAFNVGGLKSAAAGTAVTFVLPTFATNQTASVNVYYYYAP